MSAITKYKMEMVDRFWAYQARFLPAKEEWFDPKYDHGANPPVFLKAKAENNVLLDSGLNSDQCRTVLALIPPWEHHMWFRSMSSSQALAQSVFGNLAVVGLIDRLAGLHSDEGEVLFGDTQLSPVNFALEHKVTHLGEPRHTSLDGYFSGSYRVTIECKLTEAEVGRCSRPQLPPDASNYAKDYCNGSYAVQSARTNRCSLTEIGVKYWEFVPHLFNWRSDVDMALCPLNRNYQLVRNIIAVATDEQGVRPPGRGHAVLIYDLRNPAFQEGGKGLAAYSETKAALLEPTMLRKCSWQRLLAHLRQQAVLPGLMEQLHAKYGL
jgi:hypothetical protein